MKTAEEFAVHLRSLGACRSAKDWSKGMTAQEAWEKCERGDWLLWWAQKENIDLRMLTLAKGECAKTVYHLLKDDRSRRAVDAAIAFGKGEITRQELDASAEAAAKAAAAKAAASEASAYFAAAAADAVAAGAAHASAYFAAAAADAVAAGAAHAAGYAAAAASEPAADAPYFAAARYKSLKQTAEIIRSIIKPDFL
ncbi:MAG: hypothetical protein KGI50_07775 [Patescibacteria group bacterium]|nr:hypothetical protein [Patescibacteria group bacterium]